jgi:flagellar biosynthesis chaperone FliJ
MKAKTTDEGQCMKSLSTLIKLQKTHVDEQRLALARLQARLEEIEQSIAMLEIKKAREQTVAQENGEARARDLRRLS